MKFKVKVLRIAYGEIEVEVDAAGKMQASIEGLNEAKQKEISTERSEYEVTGIYRMITECSECGETTDGDPEEIVLCKKCERMMD